MYNNTYLYDALLCYCRFNDAYTICSTPYPAQPLRPRPSAYRLRRGIRIE